MAYEKKVENGEYKKGWNAAIEATAARVRDNWNFSQEMTNKKAQAARSADVILNMKVE